MDIDEHRRGTEESDPPDLPARIGSPVRPGPDTLAALALDRHGGPRSAEHRASLRRLTRARVGGWIVQLGRTHHTPRGAIARMCGIVGIVSTEPVNQQIYDSLAPAAAPRPGLHRHRDRRRPRLPHGEGARAGARGVPHPRHALAARQHRPRPRALHDEGRRRARGGGAAVLRERAVRHHPRAQRQPHEHARALGRPVLTSTAGTSTPRATPRCCSTCSPPSCRGRSRGLDLDPDQVFDAVELVHERVEGSYAVIALIAGLRAARVPRPVRHPPARSSASA